MLVFLLILPSVFAEDVHRIDVRTLSQETDPYIGLTFFGGKWVFTIVENNGDKTTGPFRLEDINNKDLLTTKLDNNNKKATIAVMNVAIILHVIVFAMLLLWLSKLTTIFIYFI